LQRIQHQENPSNIGIIQRLQGEIDEILEMEDIKWKQRSKQNWYRMGDRNTQYFHSWANHRCKVNGIHQICDEEGRVWKKKAEVSSAFISYYERMFASQGPSRVSECLAHMEPSVTNEMNTTLMQPFVEAEVHHALSQMHPLKAPGPDNFPTFFFFPEILGYNRQ